MERAASDLLLMEAMGLQREGSLDLVGRKYGLSRPERAALAKLVRWNPGEAARKKIPPEMAAGRRVGVDGFNVLITLEAIVRGEPVYLCNDSFVRDLTSFRRASPKSEISDEAVDLLLSTLGRLGASEVVVLLDSPVSRSGEMAAELRRRMSDSGLRGTAKTSRSVDADILGYGVVATSDEAIISRAAAVVDLPEVACGELGVRPRRVGSL